MSQSKLFFILFFQFFSIFFSGLSAESTDEKTVLIAILARNKGHVLPKFLECIERQNYDKKLITIYINTNDNADETEEILENWIVKHLDEYASIIYEKHVVDSTISTNPHEWTEKRFKILGKIRNNSMDQALKNECDFYFVVDCDNFIIPATLKTLVKKDLPIVAPMLRTIPDKNCLYTNFFSAVDPYGYWANHPQYYNIIYRQEIGTFKVPLVHCTYLIKSDYIPLLGYVDGSSDYEFVIFSRTARKNGVDQYICNEKEFGTILFGAGDPSLEGERKAFQELQFKKNSPFLVD